MIIHSFKRDLQIPNCCKKKLLLKSLFNFFKNQFQTNSKKFNNFIIGKCLCKFLIILIILF